MAAREDFLPMADGAQVVGRCRCRLQPRRVPAVDGVIASSYSVCNNTSVGRTFKTHLYKGTSDNNEFQTDTLTVPAYGCMLINIALPGAASSAKAAP